MDVTLPAGTYGGAGTKGWRLSASGKKWKFTDATGAAGPRGRMTVKRTAAGVTVKFGST